jgi:hypothetical protein
MHPETETLKLTRPTGSGNLRGSDKATGTPVTLLNADAKFEDDREVIIGPAADAECEETSNLIEG